MVATSSDDLNPELDPVAAARNPLRDTLLVIVVLVAAATATIFGLQYRASELGNDGDRWAARLDTTTLAAAAGIGTLVERQSAALLELADNASLRLYLWALISRGTVSSDVPTAEFAYLRGLLSANTDSGTRARTRNGDFRTLALLDAELSTVLTTPGAATTAKALQIARYAIETNTRQLVLARDASGTATLYMAVVVTPPPGAGGQGAVAGVLVSSADAHELLRPLMANLPGYFESDANLLLADGDDPVVVLSGAPELTGIDQAIDLGFATTTAAGGTAVLQSTQRVPGTGWRLVRRVSAAAAQDALQQRITAYFVALGMSVFLLATLLYAWREHSIRMNQQKTLLPMVIGNAQGPRRPATREEQMLNKLVASLVDIIDLHDPYSAFHSARLAELCRAIGRDMGLDPESLGNLVTAAMLANVGKISLPRELLTKRDELDEHEQALLHTHVEEGVEILRKLDFEDPILSAIAQKQEHLDGSGYPYGLVEDKITLPGRILAVANAYIALVSPRAYREAMSPDDALGVIAGAVGTEYDRQAYNALCRVVQSGDGLTDWDFVADAG